MNNVILVGNPNTGKTTLFNTITGAREHVGNWHGVTVEVRSRSILKLQNVNLCDLPGIYSLNAYSPEEKISVDFLNKNKNSLVINICDANNLSRNLYLTSELIEQGFNVCIAVNMAKELKNREQVLASLEESLGVKVFGIDARKRKGCKNLLDYIKENAQASTKKANETKSLNKQHLTPVINFDSKKGEDFIKKQAKERFAKIDKLLNEINYTKKGNYGQSKLDKIFFNKYLSVVCFLILFGIIFVLTFGSFGHTLSNALGEGFSYIIGKIFPFLNNNAENWFIAFLNEGVIGGVLSVLSFLPQIMLLFLFINLLEDIGYLSRVAFMLDGRLAKIGLTGRAVFSLLMGFGCTTSAITTTRNLDNQNLRKKTVLLLPNFSCSAKLPIYACICSAFFPKSQVFIVLGLYLFGVVISFIVALISVKMQKVNYTQSFIMEMPKLRFPSFSKIISSVLGHARQFIVKVGSIILAMSVITWFVSNFNFKFQYVGSNYHESIMFSISSVIAPIFSPLGFGSSAIVLALLTGFVAKEMVVGSLILTNGVQTVGELSLSLFNSASPASFTTASALSFLVFVLLYPACFSAMSVMKKELGTKFALKSFVVQFALAYICAFIVYKLASVSNVYDLLLALAFIVILAICIIFVIHYDKSKCKENCNACKFNKGNCQSQKWS